MKAVDVVVPFDPARLPAGTGAKTAQLRMGPHGSSSFAALQSSVDLAVRTILARTVHFTQFVPAQNPNPVFITTPFALPDATVGTAYTQSLAATGGATPYTWTLSSGSALPARLLLGSGGSIAGTPTSPSLVSFFLTITDSASHAVQAPFTLVVTPELNPLPILTQIAPTSASQGSAISAFCCFDIGNLLQLAAWEWRSADGLRALGLDGLRETYPTREQAP